jgi:ketosteroid isomerase-like protein
MTNDAEHPHLKHVRRYFRALETQPEEAALADFFAADVAQHEFPNRLVEKGAARGLSEILDGYRRGKTVVQNQRYQIKNALVDGDRVAIELRWTAELLRPLGKLAVGQTMSADCGVFFRFKDGRIAEQHNFDCFEPF